MSLMIYAVWNMLRHRWAGAGFGLWLGGAHVLDPWCRAITVLWGYNIVEESSGSLGAELAGRGFFLHICPAKRKPLTCDVCGM